MTKLTDDWIITKRLLKSVFFSCLSSLLSFIVVSLTAKLVIIVNNRLFQQTNSVINIIDGVSNWIAACISIFVLIISFLYLLMREIFQFKRAYDMTKRESALPGKSGEIIHGIENRINMYNPEDKK